MYSLEKLRNDVVRQRDYLYELIYNAELTDEQKHDEIDIEEIADMLHTLTYYLTAKVDEKRGEVKREVSGNGN